MLGRHGFITWIPCHAVTRLNTGGERSGVQQIIGRSLCWLIKSAAHNKDYLYFGDLRVHLIFRLRVYYKYTQFWNTNLWTNPMHHNIFQCHKKSLPCQKSLLHSLYAILFMQSVLISSQKPACVWFFCHRHFLCLNLKYYNLMKAKV